MSKLTKEKKERHKKTQENFTPIEVVKRLLPEAISITENIIDIACGTGNILIEVLKRKLSLCNSFEDCISAMKSVYGIDFMADNVEICRNRLYDEITAKYSDEMSIYDNSCLIRRIIKNRIQWCDSLVFDYDNWPTLDEEYGSIEFSEENLGDNEEFPMWKS